MDYVCLLNNAHKEVIKGKGTIKDIEDLYIAITDKETRQIEMRNDFFDKYFTDTGFHKFREEAVKLNKYITFKYDEKYTSKYNKMAEELGRLRDIEEIVNYFLRNKETAPHLLRHLVEHYSDSYKEVLSADSKLSTVHLELLEAENDRDISNTRYSRLLEKQQDTEKRLHSLVKRINFQYEKDIDIEKMDHIHQDVSNYKKILYIKEITRIHYVDSMIEHLQEILKTLHNLPVRFLVIEQHYAYHKSKMYPKTKPHIDLTYNDVFGSDIFMAGFQQNIVESVLNNPSKVDYLIVLDRSSNPVPHISGKGVETIYTVSDLKDLDFSIDNTRLITYRSDTLNIPYIRDFADLSPQEQTSAYSSMDIVKALIQLLER